MRKCDYLHTNLVTFKHSYFVALFCFSICEIDYFDTLLKLFKEYCWNNFLHNQVKRVLVFAIRKFDEQPETTPTVLTPSALQKHVSI